MPSSKRPTSLRMPRHRLARIASAAALLLAFQAAPAQTAVAVTPNAMSFNVPAQPLEQALAQFARQAGLQLAASPELIRGLQGHPVRGTLGVQAALDELLRGSGLVGRMADGLLTVEASQPAARSETSLPVVKVTARPDASSPPTDGKATDGYRTLTATSVGALGAMQILNAPFSISTVPQELLQNVQAQSLDDVYKLIPATRTVTPQRSGWSPAVMIRGFTSYDSAEDGLRRAYNHAAVLEDKERVEVLNGLSGFLYGAASPGGMANFVYKRPTATRFGSLTLGNYGGSQSYLHGDFGGPIDSEGTLGYRINLVKQDGETSIDQQEINRTLLSGAIDWQVSDDLLLQVNAVYNKYRTDGATAYWAYWYKDVPHGEAPRADKLWSQPWTQDEFENTKLMTKLSYTVSGQLKLRAAYMHDNVKRGNSISVMNFPDANGGYQQLPSRSGRSGDHFNAGQAMADWSVSTGAVSHEVTLGYSMYSDKYFASPYSAGPGFQGPYPINQPTYAAAPDFPVDNTQMYDAGTVRNSNWLIGDQLRFNAQWSALIGVNHSTIVGDNYDETGARLGPRYNSSRNSPSASLIFKPMPWLSTYLSYIEGLEQGGTAPETATNAGRTLPPMVSKQKELGVKAEVGGMLLAGAVFEIEKAYELLNTDNFYTQDGRQRHRGLELNATGKLTSRLSLVGGLTWLAPKIHGGSYDGLRPANVAKFLAKVYAEYELPAVPGLALSGGVAHTGQQWGNDTNTDSLPAVNIADLGVRYNTDTLGRPLTLRLYVSNVSNKSYWSNSYYVGAPRNLAFSAQLQF